MLIVASSILMFKECHSQTKLSNTEVRELVLVMAHFDLYLASRIKVGVRILHKKQLDVSSINF